MQLTKFHPDTMLITDRHGKELLIDVFKLPYRNVQIVLDELADELPVVTDGLAKVFSWTLPKDRFFFVDETVCLWKGLDLSKLNEEVFAFESERNSDDVLRGLFELQSLIPNLAENFLNAEKPKLSFATRIAGGNPELLRAYYTFVNEFLNDPLRKNTDLTILQTGTCDPLFLNYFVSEFFRQMSVRVSTLYNVAIDETQFTPFKVFEPLRPHAVSYIPNGLKPDFNTQANLSFLLETLYPEVYQRISAYFTEEERFSRTAVQKPWMPNNEQDFFVRTLKAIDIVSPDVPFVEPVVQHLPADINVAVSGLPETVEKKLVQDVFEFEKARRTFHDSSFYDRAAIHRRRMENYSRFYLTKEFDVAKSRFVCSKNIAVVESAWKWGVHTGIEALYPLRVIYNYAMPEGYFQTLLWRNQEFGGVSEYDLEQIEMIMLHLFNMPSSLEDVFDRMGEYFEEGREGVEQVKHIAFSKFRELLFMGALDVV